MDIQVNDSGQLVIESNDLAIVTGKDAVKQDITTRLRTFKGEAFLQKDFGIDYIYVVFNKKVSKETVDFHIKNMIKTTQGVTGVRGYLSRVRGRTLNVTIAEIATVDGNFKYEVNL